MPYNPNSKECKKCQGKSLAEIVKCYRVNFAKRFKEELIHFTDGKRAMQVLDDSCSSKCQNDKMHPHQCRVGEEVLKEVRGNLKGFKVGQYDSFAALYEAISRRIRGVHRVGVLTIYDISLRLGYSAGMFPTKVYLHTGALEGARNLQKNYKQVYWSKGLLSKECLPKAFAGLEPYEIENLLCTCKEALGNLEK